MTTAAAMTTFPWLPPQSTAKPPDATKDTCNIPFVLSREILSGRVILFCCMSVVHVLHISSLMLHNLHMFILLTISNLCCRAYQRAHCVCLPRNLHVPKLLEHLAKLHGSTVEDATVIQEIYQESSIHCDCCPDCLHTTQ